MRLTIIGAGPGGYETAVAAARKGVEVTLVSHGPLGGTCLNEGCIPTKVLCRAAEWAEQSREAADFGIKTSCRIDFRRVMARKEEVVGQLRGIGYSIMPMIVSLTGACLFRIVWIMTIFSMPQFHTLQMLYISYPVSWLLTFSIHMICYLTIARKKLQEGRTPV